MESDAVCECGEDSEYFDCAGMFTTELESELYALMLTFLDAGWSYLEAGEDAFGIVGGRELVTNRDEWVEDDE